MSDALSSALTAAEALERVLAAAAPGPTERCGLSVAAGRILRRALTASRPAPPFDRVMMDGYAVSSSAFRGGKRRFRIAGVAPAGHPAPALLTPDTAVEVMTGGMLPVGADAVVPVEWCRRDGDSVEVAPQRPVTDGLFVHRLGSSRATGDIVLAAGARLGPAELAVAATEGAVELEVAVRPRVTLVTTGDEVVPPDAQPLPWQLRASHPSALAPLFAHWGAGEWHHAHAPDREEALEIALAAALESSELVLVAGGVSMGRWDLVPAALLRLGVECEFHGVRQRPGKPLWFGRRGRRLVFGLPGNPLSALLCARHYAIPALQRLLGAAPAAAVRGRLATPLARDPRLTSFCACALDEHGRLLPTRPDNSGDLHALVGTAGMITLEPGSEPLAAGSEQQLELWYA